MWIVCGTTCLVPVSMFAVLKQMQKPLLMTAFRECCKACLNKYGVKDDVTEVNAVCIS